MGSFTPAFDAYVIVDWSASSKPKRGRDSIWTCVADRIDRRARLRQVQNVPTRAGALEQLRSTLRRLVHGGRRVLIGFDFPMGYPAGFAKALGLGEAVEAVRHTSVWPCHGPAIAGAGRHHPVRGEPWRSVWDEIARCVSDRPDNSNNRFDVAADFNRRVSGEAWPFWGCPVSAQGRFLKPRRDGGRGAALSERRLTDLRVPRAQPVWKLAYPGSAGSQALLGIPVARTLRREFDGSARVWPFETGLNAIASGLPASTLVIAEVYPSLIPTAVPPGAVKDAIQVRATARYFARLDEAGNLARLFAGPTNLSAEERRRVESEEGWILGVTADRPSARLTTRPVSNGLTSRAPARHRAMVSRATF